MQPDTDTQPRKHRHTDAQTHKYKLARARTPGLAWRAKTPNYRLGGKGGARFSSSFNTDRQLGELAKLAACRSGHGREQGAHSALCVCSIAAAIDDLDPS